MATLDDNHVWKRRVFLCSFTCSFEYWYDLKCQIAFLPSALHPIWDLGHINKTRGPLTPGSITWSQFCTRKFEAQEILADISHWEKKIWISEKKPSALTWLATVFGIKSSLAVANLFISADLETLCNDQNLSENILYDFSEFSWFKSHASSYEKSYQVRDRKISANNAESITNTSSLRIRMIIVFFWQLFIPCKLETVNWEKTDFACTMV